MLAHVLVFALMVAVLVLMLDWQLSTNLEIFNWLLFTFFGPLLGLFFAFRYAVLSCRPNLVRNVLPALYILSAVTPFVGSVCFLWGLFPGKAALWLGVAVGAFGSFVLFLSVHKYRVNFQLYCKGQGLEFLEESTGQDQSPPSLRSRSPER